MINKEIYSFIQDSKTKPYVFKLKDIYKSVFQKIKIKLINNGSENIPPFFLFKNKKDNIIRFKEEIFNVKKGTKVSQSFNLDLELMFPNDIEPENYFVVGELYIGNKGPYNGFTFFIEIKCEGKIEDLSAEKEKFCHNNFYNNYFLNLISNEKEFKGTKTSEKKNSFSKNKILVSSKKDNKIEDINCQIKQNNGNNSIDQYQNQIKILNEKIKNLTIENKNLKKEFLKVVKEKNLIKNAQSKAKSNDVTHKFDISSIKNVHVYDMVINPFEKEKKSKELFISKEIEINSNGKFLLLSSSDSMKKEEEKQKKIKRFRTSFYQNKLSEKRIKEIINELDEEFSVTSIFDLNEIKKAIIDSKGDYKKIQELLFR